MTGVTGQPTSLVELLAQTIRMPPLQFFDFHVFVQLNDVYFLDARSDYSKPDGLCCRGSQRS